MYLFIAVWDLRGGPLVSEDEGSSLTLRPRNRELFQSLHIPGQKFRVSDRHEGGGNVQVAVSACGCLPWVSHSLHPPAPICLHPFPPSLASLSPCKSIVCNFHQVSGGGEGI